MPVRRYRPLLLVSEAVGAGHVELHPVPHYLAFNVGCHGAQYTLDGGVPKLTDSAANNAYGVMVMPASLRHRVPRRAVGQRQLAYRFGILEQLQRAVDGRPAHVVQLFAHLFGGEAAGLGCKRGCDAPASIGDPEPQIIDRPDQVVRGCVDAGVQVIETGIGPRTG